MIFEFGNYTVDIDMEKTREFYSGGYVYDCSCAACRNFREYAKACPSELRTWFEALGLDIEKPSEVYYNFENKNGLLRYDGWYHICGNIVKTDRRTEIHDGVRQILFEVYEVTPELNVSFDNCCACVPSGFPKPAIQMDVTIYIPQLIPEDIN